MKRLEGIEDNQIRIKLIETLSGFVASQPNTRIMFAKETIDYPDLESHEMLCPHLAPKLIGRPRGRRKKITSRISDCSSPAPSSEFSVDSCETNDSDVFDGKHLVRKRQASLKFPVSRKNLIFKMKSKDNQKNNQRLTRNKIKSESAQSEIYTTLSTGRVSKQRLPLTPLKSSTNKRKRKADVSEDESSSDDDNQQDEDYDDKYVNRKLKQESGSKRQNSSKEDITQDEGSDHKANSSHHLPAIQIPLDSTKSSEEVDFLIRLNTFMAERAYADPKLIYGLRDGELTKLVSEHLINFFVSVNLFTIYMRVQKLGGFDAIADNRVWKNLFEDLSEPGKCITQGMTKRKYERILLPFERHERELRKNGKYTSELTISTIPKSLMNLQSNRNSSQRSSSSPAIEIIPLKNGAMENAELTAEQINEIQNIIKPKDYENQQYYNGNSNDGVSVPVHVIVRPTPSGSSEGYNAVKRKIDSDKSPGSSRSFKSFANVSGYQKPKEKENIPIMLQKHTTIVPLTRDGVPTYTQGNVVELVESDDDSGQNGGQQMKKRKLDILREGGLEVTPISRRAQAEHSLMNVPHQSSRPNPQTMQPNVSLMSLTPVRAPPVIQSLNMYQSTSQVFKNPKDDVINAARSSKSYCLDLTSKKQQQHHQNSLELKRENSNRNNQLSIEEVQRNYRGSNPDLQITLVKPQSESPSSSSSSFNQKIHNNGHNQKPRSTTNNKKPKTVPSQTLSGIPPLNPVIIAAANEFQKIQQQQLFPFLSGLDITPLHQSSAPTSPKNTPMSFDASVMSYLSAIYGNPLLQNNLLSNMSPAVELLKLYNNNSSSTNNRVPSSKN